MALKLEQLIATIRVYNPHVDEDLIHLAYEFAEKAHEGHVRMDGSPAVAHCLAVGHYLAEMHMDVTTIVAGLLHDVPDDTRVTIDMISKEFGADVAKLVSGTSRLGQIKYRGVERYAENLRQMFVQIAKDVRIIFIRFADRLHNLESLDVLPDEKRDRIAREVLEIYAPIAGRLGMEKVKTALEDGAFQHVYPDEFARISEQAAPLRAKKEEYLARVKRIVGDFLVEDGIENAHIKSRVKGLYSIYNKTLEKEVDLSSLYDLVALRVVVDTVAECYTVLGSIHAHWKPLGGRIKDYIAQPKPNNYRSLHTTVFCEDGEVVEFQIRTRDMDYEANYGVAAHWKYDETGKSSVQTNTTTEWIRDTLSLEGEQSDAEDYLDSVKLDVFGDRIFVFTPEGDVINLPEDSTSIDFAYRIHTDVGRMCVGATINDHMSSVDTPLKSGDVVSILTDKNRKKPSVDWLSFVKTSCARSHIRAQLRE